MKGTRSLGGEGENLRQELFHEAAQPFAVFWFHMDEFDAHTQWRDVPHHSGGLNATKPSSDLQPQRLA